MIGIVFLGSLLLPRLLAYYLARSTVAKQSPQELNTFEVDWAKPRFVRSMYVMTWVWGLDWCPKPFCGAGSLGIGQLNGSSRSRPLSVMESISP